MAAAAKNKKQQIASGLATLMSDDSDAMQNKPLAAAEVSAAPPQDMNAPDPAGRALAMKMAQMPVDQRMAAILALTPQELVSMRQSLQGPQLGMLTAGMTPQQKEMLVALPGGGADGCAREPWSRG